MTEPLDGPRRPRYFDGQYLDEKDFRDEQEHLRAADHRLARELGVVGIVRGLDVEVNDQGEAVVAPGFAVDGRGRHLVLVTATPFVPSDADPVVLYLAPRSVESEPQDGAGTETRWDDRPEPVGVKDGTTPNDADAIPLARLTTSGTTLTADRSVARFAGLTAPGALRVGTRGTHTTATVGVQTWTPTDDLEIGTLEASADRFVALKASDGQRCGLKLWSRLEDIGFSIQHETRQNTPRGLHIRQHGEADDKTGSADGTTRIFLGADGRMGVNKVDPTESVDIGGSLAVRGGIFADGGLSYKDSGRWWTLRLPTGWEALPDEHLGFVGQARAVGISVSDLRLKIVEGPIADASAKVAQLRGVNFRWNDAGRERLTRHVAANLVAGPGGTEEETERLRADERAKAAERLSGPQLGLIAQDVAAVCPELVETDDDGYLSVDYPHLVALLVEAVKEQQAAIEELRAALSVRSQA